MDQVLRLHHRNFGIMKLKVGFHYDSSKVIKLEVGLHYKCLDSDQHASQGGEAYDRALLQEFQGDGVSPWKSWDGIASVETSLYGLLYP